MFSFSYIVSFYFWFSRPEAQGQPGSAEPLGINVGFCRWLAGFGSLRLEDWRPCLLPGSLAHIPSHAFHRALQPSRVKSLSLFFQPSFLPHLSASSWRTFSAHGYYCVQGAPSSKVHLRSLSCYGRSHVHRIQGPGDI